MRRLLLTGLPLLLAALGLPILHPMAGSPDENAHQRYAYAVVTGQLPVGPEQQVLVPAYLVAEGPECWRFEPGIPAWCAIEDDPMSAAGSEPVRTVTQAANYPPLYYAIIGWPLRLLEGHAAVLAARALSALVLCGLAAAGAVALAGRGAPDARALALPWLLTPGTLALAGAINPQALEIGAALLMAGCAWPLARGASASRGRFVGAGAGSALLILSHPSGPIWAVLIALIACVLAWPRRRDLLRRRALWGVVAACVIACGAWLAWRLATAQTAAYADTAGRPDCSWLCVAGHIGSQAWPFARTTIGVTGWHDAWIPLPAAIACLLLLAALAAAALRRGTRAERIALVLGAVLLPVSAIVIEHQTVADAGFMWQARYALPLVLPLIWLAADIALAPAATEEGALRLRRGLAAIVVVQGIGLLALAGFAAARFWIGIDAEDPGRLPAAAVVGLVILAATVLGAGAATIARGRALPAA